MHPSNRYIGYAILLGLLAGCDSAEPSGEGDDASLLDQGVTDLGALDSGRGDAGADASGPDAAVECLPTAACGRIGRLPTLSKYGFHDVVAQDGWLFGTANGVLEVIDVRDPANARIVPVANADRLSDTFADAVGAERVGDLIYWLRVAKDEWSIQTVDVSRPEAPTQVASYVFDGADHPCQVRVPDLAVADTRAFVLCEDAQAINSTLYVIDLQPEVEGDRILGTTPIELDLRDRPGLIAATATTVFVAGSAALEGGPTRVISVNVRDSAMPAVNDTAVLPGDVSRVPRALIVRGDMVICASSPQSVASEAASHVDVLINASNGDLRPVAQHTLADQWIMAATPDGADDVVVLLAGARGADDGLLRLSARDGALDWPGVFEAHAFDIPARLEYFWPIAASPSTVHVFSGDGTRWHRAVLGAPDPAPVRLPRWPDAAIESVAMTGTEAIVSYGTGGVATYDLCDPTQPRRTRHRTTDTTGAVRVHGQDRALTIAVAEGETTLLDVRTGDRVPVAVTNAQGAWTDQGWDIDADRAFLYRSQDEQAGVEVISLTDGAVLRWLPIPGPALGPGGGPRVLGDAIWVSVFVAQGQTGTFVADLAGGLDSAAFVPFDGVVPVGPLMANVTDEALAVADVRSASDVQPWPNSPFAAPRRRVIAATHDRVLLMSLRRDREEPTDVEVVSRDGQVRHLVEVGLGGIPRNPTASGDLALIQGPLGGQEPAPRDVFVYGLVCE